MQELSALEASSPCAVERVLNDIPKELNNMYSALVKHLAERNVLFIKILIWVAYAERPLTIEELQDAINSDPSIKPYQSLSEIAEHRQYFDEKLINSKLGNLLSIKKHPGPYSPFILDDLEESSRIFFQHQSAKDFFERNRNSGIFYPSVAVEPDRYLAHTCLFYLTATETTQWAIKLATYDSSTFQKRMNDKPILHYAATNWFKHMKTREQAELRETTALIEQILYGKSPLLAVSLVFTWKHRFNKIAETFSYKYFDSTLIYFAISSKTLWLAQQIFDSKPYSESFDQVDMNEVASEWPEFFTWLCTERKEQFFKMLSPNFGEELVNYVREFKHDGTSNGPMCASLGAFVTNTNTGIATIGNILENMLWALIGRRSSMLYECELIRLLLDKSANFTTTDNHLRLAVQSDLDKITLEMIFSRWHENITILQELVTIAVTAEIYGDRKLETLELLSTKV
ncbi:hypothetical protein GGR52DRAFT_250918 [Hypoxylon sp. FL1284]|nr:hypothetical protein GGR52DRAFT_250918 [Hypoxylon sp. FL1284]